MGLESVVLSEISQSEKDKYCMSSLTCGTYLNELNKQTNRNRLIGTENPLESVRGKGHFRAW